MLIVLPAAGVVATMAAFGNHVNEPFAVFTVKDALLQVGSLPVVVGMWAWWIVVAKRERVPTRIFAGAMVGAVLHVAFTLLHALAYFDQPWNP